MARQEERKAETRARLLAAAAHCFAAHGIDAVSVDAVADAAGRTSGAVYAHFGSKQGLVMALLDEWRHSLVTTVLDDLQTVPDLTGRLRAVTVNLVVHPSAATCRLLQMEDEMRLRATRDPAVAAVMRERGAQHRQWLARGLWAWVESGLLPSGWPPDALAAAFTATVTGLAQQQRIDPSALDVQGAVAVLRAVLTAPPPEPLSPPGTHLAPAVITGGPAAGLAASEPDRHDVAAPIPPPMAAHGT